jgi:hypothetical protein
MIASPGDVADERAIVTKQLHRWNDANAATRQIVLLPVKWETHSTPQLGAPAQTIINNQLLDDVDIMIGIFGTRIGTPTEHYISGSVEEIKKHVAAGKTAKVYFSDVPRPPSAVDPEQYASVQKFREECERSGLYATYESLEQFTTDFSHHLDLEMNQARYLWLATLAPVPENDEAVLSEDALRLLRAVANDDGDVVFQSGMGLRVGDEEFVDGTPRSAARWQAALDELVNFGAMNHVSGDLHRVTDYGYKIADKEEERKRDTLPSVFHAQKRHRVEQLLSDLQYFERDLLRLLLLNGDIQGSKIPRQMADRTSTFDFNGLIRNLLDRDLIRGTVDREQGVMTLSITPNIVDVLRELLFPREGKENKAPYFIGI